MKDIEIVISKDTRMVELSQTTIGNDGENLQSKLVFTFEDDAFVDGQARLEYYANGEKYWTVAEKKENSYEVPVLSVMANEGRIDMQLVITEGTDENEIPIFKSNMFYVYCNSSINAEIEQPEEYPEWIDKANTKLNEVENLNVEMNDGVVTITKKDGTTYSENVRGPEGPQGKAGAVKLIPVTELPTENIEEDAIYLVPNEDESDEENKHKEYVYTNGRWEPFGSGGAAVEVDLPTVYLEVSGMFWNTYNTPQSPSIALAQKVFDAVKTYGFAKNYLLYDANYNKLFLCKVLKNGNTVELASTKDGYNSGNDTLSCYIDIRSSDNVVNNVFVTQRQTKILTTDNISSYNVENDYNPAHKKYVDEAIANAPAPEPDYFYIAQKSFAEATINFADYKAKCLKFKRFVPIFLNIRQATYPIPIASVMAYPVVHPEQGKLLRFVGLNDCHISNTATLDAFIVVNQEITGTYNSPEELPDEGTFIVKPNRVSYLRTDNTDEYTPTADYNPATKKYVDNKYTSYSGYDSTKTQVLKNINGTLTWVDE